MSATSDWRSAFPQTYMNDSGLAVAALVRRFGIDDLEKLVIVHDELDLEVGRLKVKVGGGLAGHNGLKSIVAHLKSDAFVRVRIGIGKPPGQAVRRRPRPASKPTKKQQDELAIVDAGGGRRRRSDPDRRSCRRDEPLQLSNTPSR